MSDLKGTPGELRFTITVKRAATGAVETYEMVSQVTAEQAAAIIGREHGAAGAIVGAGSAINQAKEHENGGDA